MNAALILTAGDPTGYVAGDYLVRSIRSTMPGIEILQLTDETSPCLIGVDTVRRMPKAPLAEFIVAHWAELEGDWLFVDTDVVVQKDVRPVFDELTFELAVATREGTYLPGEAGGQFMKRMPYNCGVVYSKGRAARQELCRRVQALPKQDREWYGVQLGMASMNPLVLYNTFNYPPLSVDDPHIADAYVVHYKGPWRKQMLFQRIYQEGVCA